MKKAEWDVCPGLQFEITLVIHRQTREREMTECVVCHAPGGSSGKVFKVLMRVGLETNISQIDICQKCIQERLM